MKITKHVDDEREEHRMLIRLNDFNPILASLLIGQEHEEIQNQEGILRQKVHDHPYTITLYCLLKDYGMTPISRIKPRVHFSRRERLYDDVSAGSPVLFPLNAKVDFVEFKFSSDKEETSDQHTLRHVFGDSRTLEHLANDPAAMLVAQHDLFLMKPPVKLKTKLSSFGDNGVPIGEFIGALNNPKKASRIFQRYHGGKEFAHDLRQVLEPFEGLEFTFGIYSRYKRWDCVYDKYFNRQAQPYRTTFDPFTVLGWIQDNEDAVRLQPLMNERYARWEHKISPEAMDRRTLQIIARHIRNNRKEYLIPRCLSKSQTALTLLKEERESSLALLNELGYSIALEIPIKSKNYADIDARKKLRAAFRGSLSLHPQNTDIVENHKNLALGYVNDLEYMLDTSYLAVREKPTRIRDENVTIIVQPHYHKDLITSAENLRVRLPKGGFDKYRSVSYDECGYTVYAKGSGRSYTVSYGRRNDGAIRQGKTRVNDTEQYVSIRYLGIAPRYYRGILQGKTMPITLHEKPAEEIVHEMKEIMHHLKDKHAL